MYEEWDFDEDEEPGRIRRAWRWIQATRRLVDLDTALRQIGRVPWRLVDPEEAREPGITVTAGIVVAFDMPQWLEPYDTWTSPSGTIWRRWPSARVRDMLPAFTAARGPIRFVVPPDTGHLRRSLPEAR